MKLTRQLRILLSLGFLLIAPYSAIAQEKVEVVLLVDVSGSMKNNDPKNLRIPATNLLINLLKNKTNLAIFTFSATAKLLEPKNEVTSAYQKSFSTKQNQINSSGKYTNILAALDAANKSWSDNKSRFIILLTDGKIDRGSAAQDSKDIDVINKRVIPELKKNNVKVYPIGLGKNTDIALLNALANQTNGVYQSINSMSDAEKSLYNVFNSTVPAQGIPLDKESSGTRKIRVDSSISQLSIVIEKKNDLSKISISKPDGTLHHLDNLNFNKFTLIDIKNPAPGIWKLNGDEQTVERAIILTNLELVSTKLSGEYFNRELLTVSTTLKLGKQDIDFTKLLVNTEVKLNLTNENGTFSTVLPSSNDILFKKQFILDLQPGMTKQILTARNNSFLRENQSLFNILPTPFTQTLEKDHLKIELINSDIIRDSIQVNLVEQKQNLSLPLFQNDGHWQTSTEELCALQKTSAFYIHAEIQAKSKSGRSVTIIMPEEKIVCTITPAKLESNIPSIDLNNADGSAPPDAQLPPKTTEIPQNNLLINLFYILSLIFFISLIAIAWFYYNKTRKAYKEKIDELGDNDD